MVNDMVCCLFCISNGVNIMYISHYTAAGNFAGHYIWWSLYLVVQT